MLFMYVFRIYWYCISQQAHSPKPQNPKDMKTKEGVLCCIIMKQILKYITEREIKSMIILKWHRMVDSADYPSYESYSTVGRIYDIDGSSARRVILNWFDILGN